MSFEKSQQNKDLEYTKRFQKDMPEGQREVMKEHIQKCAKDGLISIFASMEGFTEKDKEKMSTFRTLAKEMGYEIGSFILDRNHGTATAEIKKIE